MKLTDVCDFQGGSQPPKEEWSYKKQDGFIRMLQIRDFTQSEKVTPEYIKLRNNTKICEADDILIARYGASIGKILTGLAGAYNVAIMRTIPDETILKKRYLYYYLKSSYFQNNILNVGSRAAQAGFNKEDLSKLSIHCPKIEEQDDIADILEKVEKIIAERERELKLLEEFIKARFVEIFGDPVTNSMGWPKKRFDEICENLDSKRKPITESEREAGIYPYYGASGIVDHVADYIFDEDILLVSEDGANLLMRSTPIAFSVNGKVWVNNHAHVVRFKKISMQKYIEVYFSLIDISDQITGSAQPKLNQAKLNAMQFAIPEDRLMDKYYEFVAQIDKSKVAVQKALDEAQLLFDSLMQQYFG